ncbi:MAG: acyltransferase family protein [Thermoanaerobaculia bacterium]
MRLPVTSPATTPPAGAGDAYRPEVDGLRAVAVLIVLFFHAGIPGFRGGFVGVDVFFVISGYLITRLILGELDGDRFTFSRFYGRRARRLFPAMFATLAATFVASLFILSPLHLEELSLSLVHTLFSLSNVLFWSLSGYFDIGSELKPLLHTWSLGVEEQFYLVWPISVFLAFRFRRRRGVLALVGIVGLASLVAAEIAAGRAPDAAFFLTPFRMCELALGGLCLWLERSPAIRTWRRDLLTLLGLALIAYATHAFGPGHRFPGLAAMVPCGGAGLVLVAGRGRVAGALLANRLAVGIGLISYSLYLVHWPLFVLVRYGRTSESTPGEKATLIAAAIALATAMYFFVEQPFRRKRAGGKRLSDPAFGLACAGLAGALILPAVSAMAARGWPGRVPTELRAAAAGLEGMKNHHFDAANAQDRVPFPAPGRRNAVIVGDSHGADLLTALMHAGSQVNYRFLHIFWNCQPILGARPYGEGTPIRSREIAEDCVRQSNVLQDNPLLEAADVIVVASSWIDYGLAGLPATLDYLKSRYKARLVIVGGRFAFTELSALLIQAATVDEANQRFDAAKGKYGMKQEIAELSATAESATVDFVDLRPYTCDALRRGWYCPLFLEDGELLYWDSNHWTEAGARRVGKKLRDSGEVDYLF